MTTETAAQKLGRIVLGSLMTLAGIGHLSFARAEFQAQVPAWVPVPPMSSSWRPAWSRSPSAWR